jgi:replication factor A1
MKVNELKPKQGKIDIVLEVTEKSEPKEFSKFGSTGRVCNAKGKDETGEIAVTLWNEQIDQVNVGDKIHITNGYVSEYQGEMQLSTGKFGQLKVLGKEEAEQAKKDVPEDEEPLEVPEETELEPSEEDLAELQEDLEEELVE